MPGRYFGCAHCKKPVYRDFKRINENRKRGWSVFCSQRCLNESKITRKTYVCSRNGCKNKFTRTPSEGKKVKKFYCSSRCSAISNNHLRVRICSNLNCKKKYTCKRKRKYCSSICIPVHHTKYSQDMVILEINKYVNQHRRIPVKRELNCLYRAARKYFGTWNNAIKASGYDPNPVMFANKHIAKDGHKCDSFAEKIIDDWLFERKIEHKRSVPYPSNNNFTCDFVVGDKWIEFFGLAGELKKYDYLKRRKLGLVRKYNINLVKLFPDDIFPKNKLDLILGT